MLIVLGVENLHLVWIVQFLHHIREVVWIVQFLLATEICNYMWKTTLDQWASGNYPVFPKRVMWRTSRLDAEEKLPFKEEFVYAKLPKKQDYTKYKKYFKNARFAVAFMNLTNDVMLVVPVPRNKNFATVYDFSKNASKLHQRMFWKFVAKIARQEAKKGDVYISTHGLGVPYLHVRISHKPIHYYKSKVL
jgi:hypothetical protein